MTGEKNDKLVMFKQQLAGADLQKQLLNYLGQDQDRLRKMQSAVITSVQKVPDLLTCDRNSMMQAIIACAEYNLYPSAVSGEAFILPYKGKAQFQLGYQGIITLLYRAGVDAVNTQIVYDSDTFEYEEGLDSKLVHVPTKFGQKRGEAIGVYAIAAVNGQKIYKVMSRDEVMSIKALSSARDSKYSPWNSNDPQLWMWRKTCLKQLAKVLPKNDTLIEAIGQDNEESVIADIPNRRVINTEALRQDAPTMGKLSNNSEKNGKDKKTEGEERDDDLFDIAKGGSGE